MPDDMRGFFAEVGVNAAQDAFVLRRRFRDSALVAARLPAINLANY